MRRQPKAINPCSGTGAIVSWKWSPKSIRLKSIKPKSIKAICADLKRSDNTRVTPVPEMPAEVASQVPDMLRITPADIHAAQAHVLHLDELLTRHSARTVTERYVAQQKEVTRARAEVCQRSFDQSEFLRRELHLAERKVQRVERSLRFRAFWRTNHAAAAIWLTGLPCSVFFGFWVNEVFGNTTLGALVGLILFCGTVLAFVAWIQMREGAEGKITSLQRSLVKLNRDLQHVQGRLLEADQATDNAYRQWQEAKATYDRSAYALELRTSYEKASARCQSLLELYQSRRYQLAHSNWRDLRGLHFENFLRDVFEVLGYHVEMTKASGDQGLDLVVTRNGQRIGVQAKGYNGTVGNDAVRQAYAGMTHYGCQVCAVITNSFFTRQAKELALSVNCRLIDQSELPSLIANGASLC